MPYEYAHSNILTGLFAYPRPRKTLCRFAAHLDFYGNSNRRGQGPFTGKTGIIPLLLYFIVVYLRGPERSCKICVSAAMYQGLRYQAIAEANVKFVVYRTIISFAQHFEVKTLVAVPVRAGRELA